MSKTITISAKDLVNKRLNKTIDVMDHQQVMAEDVNDFDDKQLTGYTEMLLGMKEVPAISINSIEDTKGRVCEMARAVEIETGLAVIPFSILGVSTKIKSIQKHEIIHLKNITYCMSKSIREDVVEDLERRISEKISCGISFQESLWRTATYNGVKFETIYLNFEELSYIKSRFREFDTKCLKSVTDDMILSVDLKM